MEHTERRWSRDKLGYGNKDLILNHQPTHVSVEVNIHQLQVFIGLMNDFLLQHSEHRSTGAHMSKASEPRVCLTNEVL